MPIQGFLIYLIHHHQCEWLQQTERQMDPNEQKGAYCEKMDRQDPNLYRADFSVCKTKWQCKIKSDKKRTRNTTEIKNFFSCVSRYVRSQAMSNQMDVRSLHAKFCLTQSISSKKKEIKPPCAEIFSDAYYHSVDKERDF